MSILAQGGYKVEKLKRKSLSDRVLEIIQQNIIENIYRPGDKLPVENELAQKFGVSRITIREAITKLSFMGIVTIKQGEGTFIRKVTPESFMKPLLPMLLLDQKNIYDISVARLTIEVKTIELAAENATEQDIDYLASLVDKMESDLANKELNKYNSHDVLFHLHIAKASGNLILYKVLEIIQDLMKGQITITSAVPFANERSIEGHKIILQAIKNKDKRLATKTMKEHINSAVEYLKNRSNEGVNI